MMVEIERLMPAAEVAQILHLKESSAAVILGRWVKARKIRGYKIGRHLMFRPADVQAYIAKQVVR